MSVNFLFPNHLFIYKRLLPIIILVEIVMKIITAEPFWKDSVYIL